MIQQMAMVSNSDDNDNAMTKTGNIKLTKTKISRNTYYDATTLLQPQMLIDHFCFLF